MTDGLDVRDSSAYCTISATLYEYGDHADLITFDWVSDKDSSSNTTIHHARSGGCRPSFQGRLFLWGCHLLDLWSSPAQCLLPLHQLSKADGQVLALYVTLQGLNLVAGCPFVHTIHVKEPDFVWSWLYTEPSGSRVDYYENPLKQHKRRFRCKQCGAPVASFNMRTAQFSVWGACLERGPDGEILEWARVKPTAHQFYGTRMLDVNDELGKWEGYEGKSEKL